MKITLKPTLSRLVRYLIVMAGLTDYLRIRFTIPLESNLDTARAAQAAQLGELFIHEEQHGIRRQAMMDVLDANYNNGTLVDAEGWLQGRPVPFLTFDVVQRNTEQNKAKARLVAATLAAVGEQDTIGLIFEPVELEIIRAGDAPGSPAPDTEDTPKG